MTLGSKGNASLWASPQCGLNSVKINASEKVNELSKKEFVLDFLVSLVLVPCAECELWEQR